GTGGGFQGQEGTPGAARCAGTAGARQGGSGVERQGTASGCRRIFDAGIRCARRKEPAAVTPENSPGELRPVSPQANGARAFWICWCVSSGDFEESMS